MRRHLLVILVTAIGMLVFASGAFAADTLTLCVKKDGTITAPAAPKTCKSGETPFVAVSSTALADLQGQVSALQTQNTAQQRAIDDLTGLLQGVTRKDTTLRFTGMNLQVVNGTGATDGPAAENGLGNIVIGYNFSGEVGAGPGTDDRTGSHNLVIGDMHSYTKTSGIVMGIDNMLSAPWAFAGGWQTSVSGIGPFAHGFQDIASGDWSFVGGGSRNTASGRWPFVGGGAHNTASGETAFASGGSNTASGVNSFVGGGFRNTASDFASFASGTENLASGRHAFVGGGKLGTASGVNSFVGGYGNTAGEWSSFVGGGAGNIASGVNSFVGGGENRTAGPGGCANIFGSIFGTC